MLIELDSRTLDGRLFQSLAPLTQKKLSRKSSLARGTFKGRNDCWWRVFGSLLCWSVNNVLCSMFQNPRRNLNISIASPRCRLSSRVVRPSCFILWCCWFDEWLGAEFFPKCQCLFIAMGTTLEQHIQGVASQTPWKFEAWYLWWSRKMICSPAQGLDLPF